MKAYCGQTREQGLVALLASKLIGECTVRGELKSRRRAPWFYDNGAYRDWTAGKPFNAMQFVRDMRRIRYSKGVDASPDFVVLPDVVAGGVGSLAFSSEWFFDLGDLPAYVAVQNGMTVVDVRTWINESRVSSAVIAVATLDKVLRGWDAATIAEHADALCFSNGENLGHNQVRWFFGPVAYLLRDVVELPKPVPCRGWQGFWTLTPELERAVVEQLA